MRQAEIKSLGSPIGEAEFYKFMKDVFKAPPRGSERMMICPIGYVKVKSGYGVEFARISDDGETWRELNEEELETVRSFFTV